jgi:hypothetical protein
VACLDDAHGEAVAGRAGGSQPRRPDTPRHAFMTAALDAGVPRRDVRTTMR